jgi:hypothetical protein
MSCITTKEIVIFEVYQKSHANVMTKISESVAQQLSEEWKSLPISVDEAQFKHFELLPGLLARTYLGSSARAI